MAIVEDFSDLVADIYSCVTAPEEWVVVLDRIGRTLDASAAIVEIVGVQGRIVHGALPRGAEKSYAAYYSRLDHVLADVAQGPVGLVRTGAELIWPHTKSEFHVDWALPNGFEDGFFVRLSKGIDRTSLMLPTSRRQERADTPQRERLIASLAVHLRQALRMERALCAGGELASFGIPQQIRHGILVVTGNGRICYTTPTAEFILRREDGVRSTRSGAVQALLAVDDQALQHAIRCATGVPTPVGRSLSCTRASGKPPHVVHVCPVGVSRAMLTIIDPALPCQPEAGLLCDLFGLTSSEAQIARMVIDHQGLQAVALELSVSLATVKTHLLNIFDKTGTHRQSDLVRLLVTLDPLGTAWTQRRGPEAGLEARRPPR